MKILYLLPLLVLACQGPGREPASTLDVEEMLQRPEVRYYVIAET